MPNIITEYKIKQKKIFIIIFFVLKNIYKPFGSLTISIMVSTISIMAISANEMAFQILIMPLSLS